MAKLSKQRMDQMQEEWEKKMREFDPSVFLIIRAHVLLEEQINLYLERKVPNPEFVDGFRFRAKVQLVRALSEDGKWEEFWQLIDLLTALRNQSAHKPHEKSGSARMDTLMKIFDVVAKLTKLDVKRVKEMREVVKAENKESPSPALIRMGFSCAQEFLASMTEILPRGTGR
jgi:hypothetical protein